MTIGSWTFDFEHMTVTTEEYLWDPTSARETMTEKVYSIVTMNEFVYVIGDRSWYGSKERGKYWQYPTSKEVSEKAFEAYTAWLFEKKFGLEEI